MSRRHLIPVLLAAAALPLLAACGGGDDAGPIPTRAAAQTVEAPAAGDAVAVEMAASQFAPAQITVAKGQAVRWTNEDAIAHTVTATAGAAFDSGTVEPGGDFTWTAAKAGRVSYVCLFHPGMTATIVVR